MNPSKVKITLSDFSERDQTNVHLHTEYSSGIPHKPPTREGEQKS